ncbi:Response regulator PleD [compost metagenome]
MNKTTIIIDDDKISVFLLKILLKNSEIVPGDILTMDGEKALEYFSSSASHHTEFLVFLDLRMPGMNGWELLEHFNRFSFSENIFVVIVSASAEKNDYIKAFENKLVVDYLTKPLDKYKICNLTSTLEILGFGCVNRI